jgi:hypothetical protein
MLLEPVERSPGWFDRTAAGPQATFPVWGPVHVTPVCEEVEAYSRPCGWLGASRTTRRVPADRAGSLPHRLRVGGGFGSGVAGIFGLIPLTSFWRGWSCSSPSSP